MENNLMVILSGCRQGDPAWQKVLYEQYYGYVFTICIRYASTREEATQILNDGFVRAFRGLSSFDVPEKDTDILPAFMGWLKKIMIHTGINYKKSLIRQISWDSHDNEAENLPSKDRHPIESMAYEELVALIQNLSPAYRHVFSLFVLDGYSHEDIAKIMNISIGTSKSNLLKARGKLRKMLELSHAEEISRYDR